MSAYINGRNFLAKCTVERVMAEKDQGGEWIFMRKKRIAMIVPTLWNGGAEKVAADMSIFLSDAGYDVFFFLNQYDRKNNYPHKGKEVVVMQEALCETGNLGKQIYQYGKWALLYRKYKRKYKIDISISFMVPENFVNVLSDIGDKKILTFHSVTSHVVYYYGKIFVRPFVLKMMCQKATASVAVSKYVKWDLQKLMGLKKDVTDVIYNSIDICKFETMAQETAIANQYDNTILYVGRLDDEKRPWIVVRVMQEVVQRYENVKLLMLGKGENLFFLKRLISKFKLQNNIELLGFQKNVAKYMAGAKMIISCSETEAFSCSVLEAITFGIPAVVVDNPGGVQEVISSERAHIEPCKVNRVVDCGIITPAIASEKRCAGSEQLSKEERMLAQAIILLLEDESLRERLGKNARKRARRFSEEKIRKEWLTLLKKI